MIDATHAFTFMYACHAYIHTHTHANKRTRARSHRSSLSLTHPTKHARSLAHHRHASRGMPYRAAIVRRLHSSPPLRRWRAPSPHCLPFSVTGGVRANESRSAIRRGMPVSVVTADGRASAEAHKCPARVGGVQVRACASTDELALCPSKCQSSFRARTRRLIPRRRRKGKEAAICIGKCMLRASSVLS